MKNKIKEKKKEREDVRKILPEWAKSKTGIQNKINSMKDFNSQFYLKQILKNPSQKDREKMILEVLQKENDPEIKRLYIDFF